MTTSSIQSNIILGLGEGAQVANASMLAYALRWANAAYRDIILRPTFKHPQKRTIFKTVSGQQTYHAPSGFLGFCILKDETNNNPLEIRTQEDFTRQATTFSVSGETWTSSLDVAVALDNTAIVQYSERVYDSDGTYYVRDTDYTMDYVSGTVTAVSGQGLSDATDYYIDYTHYTHGNPQIFSLEYDTVNKLYVMRMDPTPDSVLTISLTYFADSSALSDSVDPIWSAMEYAIERGGIYFGSLEIIEDQGKRMEFKALYDDAMSSLIRLHFEFQPKRPRIQVCMRRSDFYAGQSRRDY